MFRQTLVGGIGYEHPLNEPRGAADVDRLPSVYAGVVAFVRDTPRQAGLVYLFDPTRGRLMRLAGGPDPRSSGRPHGLALRANTLAFSWSWQSGRSQRWALMLETVGAPPRTLVTIPATRGQIVGPTWDANQLYFAIATSKASTISATRQPADGSTPHPARHTWPASRSDPPAATTR